MEDLKAFLTADIMNCQIKIMIDYHGMLKKVLTLVAFFVTPLQFFGKNFIFLAALEKKEGFHF